MENNNGEEIRKLHKSFKHAYRGLRYSLVYERNFQIEIVCALVVFFLIFIFKKKLGSDSAHVDDNDCPGAGTYQHGARADC